MKAESGAAAGPAASPAEGHEGAGQGAEAPKERLVPSSPPPFPYPPLPLSCRPAAGMLKPPPPGMPRGDRRHVDKLVELSSGHLGELRAHASGRMTMKIGEVVYEVSPGVDCAFQQDVRAAKGIPRGRGKWGSPRTATDPVNPGARWCR